MYEQEYSFNVDHFVKLKRFVLDLLKSHLNTNVKFFKDGGNTSLLLTGKNGEEFNTVSNLVNREIHALNESLSTLRIKKRLEKEKIRKKKLATAASNIEKSIKNHEVEMSKKVIKDYTYYVNGEASTNPKNGYFGLPPDAECP